MSTSAQVKFRAWVANMRPGVEFTTGDARAFLAQEGFDPRQSGSLLTYMVTWWKLVERVSHGRYRRL